jgi:hypothetical protein
VDTVRDLAQGDPWRESLERSLARRTRSSHASIKQSQPYAVGPRAEERRALEARADARRLERKAVTRRGRTVAMGARGIIGLLLLAAFLMMALDGQAPHVSSASARSDVIQAPAYAKTRQDGPVSPGAGLSRSKACPMVVGTAGYVNPLARAKVTPERIDQGVDYAGSGSLLAIGTARVTHVAVDGTGWPGAFIEYRLLDGPDAGCHVFYAEGVTPEPGLRVGDTLLAGQRVAKIIPLYETGVEIGWGAGTGTATYAAATGRWSADDDQNDVPSGPGKNFSALVAALGGPPGKVEG